MGVQLAASAPGKQPPMNPGLATPLYALAGVVAILFLSRTISIIRQQRRLRAAIHDNNHGIREYSTISSPYAFIKCHLLYAPLFSTRHSREFRVLGRLHMGTVPLRLEALFLLAYVLLNVIFIVCLIDWSSPFQVKMFQLKYAAGHLAVMNSPALVVSAGRNNPLIWLCGIQFDTFNLVHRWIGRIMAAEALMHMGCVVGSLDRKMMSMGAVTQLMWNVPFFIYGLVALVGFVLIAFTSLSPVRHTWYETFLHLHILLAIMSFIALWYHLRNLYQQRVLLATVILWGLEHLARLLILLWRNVGHHCTTATIELLPDNVARVDVAVSRPWSPKPGQYLYLYVPSLGLWTSHPFSVAWSSTDCVDVSTPSPPLSPHIGTTLSPLRDHEKRASDDSLSTLIGGPARTTMSILVKARDGFTRNIYRQAERSETGLCRVSALAEGPFGGLHSLTSYETVLLIAGGIGITHPLSHLQHLVSSHSSRGADRDAKSARTSATRHVCLVWMVRSLDHLAWITPWMTTLTNHPALQPTIMEPEIKNLPAGTDGDGASASSASGSPASSCYMRRPDLTLSIQIYVTGRGNGSEDGGGDDGCITHDTPWTRQSSPNVPVLIEWGKPDFGCVLDTLRVGGNGQVGTGTPPPVGTSGRGRVGAIAVSVCGPGGMGDDVRRAVRGRQGCDPGGVGRGDGNGNGDEDVDLFEESFSW